MKQNKVKEWFKKNKTELETGIIITVAGCAGWILGTKIDGLKTNMGMMRAVEEGFLILTKPSENGEIIKLTTKEWNKVIREFDWK